MITQRQHGGWCLTDDEGGYELATHNGTAYILGHGREWELWITRSDGTREHKGASSLSDAKVMAVHLLCNGRKA